MAAASSPPLDPPLGGPSGVHVANPNDRTVPEWMDASNIHGQRIILQLSAAEDSVLPKNPFVIGKSIEQACGKIESANTEERGSKYVIKTRSVDQAKKLLSMVELIDGSKVKIIPHPSLNTSRCVVSCREVIDMTEKDLEEELRPQGVSAVRRITRLEGSERVNTPTLVLTVYGTVSPKHIMFGPLRIPTRLFYPSPMICFNCCSYGHTKARCQSAAVCKSCSGNHPLENSNCEKEPFCKNCQGSHSPTSRKCAVYVKEEKIIKIKTETGVSFGEARKEYEKLHGSNSYAAVSSVQGRLQQIRQECEKDNEIRLLKEEVAKMKKTSDVNIADEKDKEIAKLREEIKQLKQILEQLNQVSIKPLSIDISTSDGNESGTEGQNDEEMDEEYTPAGKNGTKPRSRSAKKRVQRKGSSDGGSSAGNKRNDGGSDSKVNSPKAKRGRPRKH